MLSIGKNYEEKRKIFENARVLKENRKSFILQETVIERQKEKEKKNVIISC